MLCCRAIFSAVTSRSAVTRLITGMALAKEKVECSGFNVHIGFIPAVGRDKDGLVGNDTEVGDLIVQFQLGFIMAVNQKRESGEMDRKSQERGRGLVAGKKDLGNALVKDGVFENR